MSRALRPSRSAKGSRDRIRDAVRYDEFRNSFLLALREADLYTSWDRPTETIDLETMSRSWKSSCGSGPKKEIEPFHVYGMASFRWDPLDSARAHTTEEDLVTELFGRDDELRETMQRTLRTDIVLHANLPWNSRTPMPDGRLWQSWSARVDELLAPFLPREVAQLGGDPVVAMGWRGTVEVESRCSQESELRLRGVSVPAWHMLVLPRIRDGFDDDPDADIERQLDDLAEGYRAALDVWMDSVAELRQHLDLAPDPA